MRRGSQRFTKRQEKTAAALQSKANPYPHPEAGQWYQIYWSTKQLGSGVRLFLVLRVSKTWVTLYYVPQLMVLRLTPKEWNALVAVKQWAPSVDRCEKMAEALQEQMDKWDKIPMRYNGIEAEKALILITEEQTKCSCYSGA